MTDRDSIRILEGQVAQLQAALRLLIDATQGYLGARPNDREAKMRKLQRVIGLSERNESQPMLIRPVSIIAPVLYARLPVVSLDGRTFEQWPFQVFQTKNDCTEIRFGNNLMAFEPYGDWYASECFTKNMDHDVALRLSAAYRDDGHNQRPTTAYYGPEAPGYASETAAWPKTTEEKGKMH